MGGKTPGRIRFKHTVLQDKVFGVGPVVGNFVKVMVSHHIRLPIPTARRGIWVDTTSLSIFGLRDETIHLPMIDISSGVWRSMWSPMIQVLCIMIGSHTLARQWIVDTHCGHAILHWNAICTWIRAEVAVERSILLHNHDDMLDFVDITILKLRIGTPAGSGATAGSGRSAGRKRRCYQKKRQDDGGKVLGNFSVDITDYLQMFTSLRWFSILQFQTF